MPSPIIYRHNYNTSVKSALYILSPKWRVVTYLSKVTPLKLKNSPLQQQQQADKLTQFDH